MKQLLGSLYLLTLSYKRDVTIFWFINTSIIAVLLLVASIFKQNMMLVLTVSVPVYVFMIVISSKLLNRTLPFFLKLGVNRLHYTIYLGLFLFGFSIMQSVIVALLQKLAVWVGNMISMDSIMLIHPVMLFEQSSSPNLLLTILVDALFIMFLCLMGLMVNIAFYRFGTMGGYSLLGVIVLIPLLSLLLNWLDDIIKVVQDLTLTTFAIVGCAVIALLCTLFIAGLRKISIVAAQ